MSRDSIRKPGVSSEMAFAKYPRSPAVRNTVDRMLVRGQV